MDRKIYQVYWAPYFENDGTDWSQLYQGQLTSLYQHLQHQQNHQAPKNQSMFYCPVFSDLARRTFLLTNGLESGFEFDHQGQLRVTTRANISCTVPRMPSMQHCAHLTYNMRWIFFSADPVALTLLPPYFHPAAHCNQGNIVPGHIQDISSYFRVMNMEFVLRPHQSSLHLAPDEALAYVQFDPPEPGGRIELERFEITDRLRSYAKSCHTSTEWEPWVPFLDRLRRFRASGVRQQILREIRANVIPRDA